MSYWNCSYFYGSRSLEAKAKEMNILFKVETNGATGPKNVLTAEEISKARCIIVAADKQVEMSRFDGRPVIITKVADGINKAEELLSQAINGNVEIIIIKEIKWLVVLPMREFGENYIPN